MTLEHITPKWYSSVEMCTIAETVPSIPCTCLQTQLSNVPADLPSQYYLRNLSIPIIDHLLSELTSRFSSHHKTALLVFLPHTCRFDFNVISVIF